MINKDPKSTNLQMDIEVVFEFFKFIDKARLIKRAVKTNDDGRMENVMEHSFQLAIMGWFLNSKYKLGLDENLIIKYALIHDLIEIYAGDTDPYVSESSHISSQSEREADAVKRIENEFGDFAEFHESIVNYEKKIDKESKFVCGLDGLLPSMHTFLNEDDYYSKNGVTIERWIERNIKKTEGSEVMGELRELLAIYYKNKRKDFFANK